MIPLTLSVRNFLSYGERNTVLDFRDFSIACLSGKNGHGKSALIDAMTWALWGKCRVKIKEEVIKRGAPDARVELEFETEGVRYRILRAVARKKGGSTSSLDLQVYDDGSGSYKPVEQGVKAQAEIEKILKMDYNSFICSSFILQGMADEFTKRTPAERKEVLAKILELDEYDKLTRKARERVHSSGTSVTVLENERQKLDSEIAERDNIDKQLEKSRAEEAKVSADVAEFESIYGKLIGEYESVKAKLERLSEITSERQAAALRCESLNDELRTLTEQIQKEREILSREKEISEGFGEYETAVKKEKLMSVRQLEKSKLEKEIGSLSGLIEAEKAKIEHKIGTLATRIEEQNKTVLDTEGITRRKEEIETGYKKLCEMIAREKELSANRQAVEKVEAEISDVSGKIKQKKLELEAKADQMTKRIDELLIRSALGNKLEKQIRDLKSLLKECTEAGEKAERTRDEMKSIGEEEKALAARRKEIARAKEEEQNKLGVLEADTHEAECPLCESPLGQEARQALIEKLRSAVSALETSVREIDKSAGKLREKGKALAEELKQAESRASMLPQLNKELGEKGQGIKESELARRELEELNFRLETLKSDIAGGEHLKEHEDRLAELKAKKRDIGYDAQRHGETKNGIERLRKYETEREILRKDMKRRSEAESGIESAERELEPLKAVLNEERFASEQRERRNKLTDELKGLGYSESEHEEVRKTVRKLESYREEKEGLEKARINLGHRENEEKKLRERIGEEKNKLAGIEREIGELEGIKSAGREIKEKMSTAENRITALKKQKDEILKEISRSESALERISNLESRKKELKEEIADTKHETVVYRELVKAFGKNGLQALIIEHAVPEIEIEANRILNRLTEGTMALSLEMVKPTQKGGEKETLEIYIGDSAGTRSYETFSGGEAFRIDFALRVAISKFIANRSGAQLRTLVIDEGFGTQDKDGLDHFVQVINSIKGDFDKILAITHVDELKERFPVRIEVTKEPGEGSKFEVVYS